MKIQNNQVPEYREHNSEENEISIFDILAIILRYKWLIIILCIAGLVLGYLFTKINNNKEYESKATILLDKPVFSKKQNAWQYQQYTRNIVRASYKSVIYSNENLRKILKAHVITTNNGKKSKTSLSNLLGLKNISNATEYLKGIINLKFDKRTYILVITTKTNNPIASKFIIEELIKQLNLFYNTQIDVTSKNEINILKKNLESVKNELKIARNNELKLYQNNKLLTDSTFRSKNDLPPKLKLEKERLSELVTEKKNIYNSMVKQYDDLRYSNVENISLVTIIEKPEASLNPLPSKSKIKVLIGAILGIILSALIIFIIEFLIKFKKITNTSKNN